MDIIAKPYNLSFDMVDLNQVFNLLKKLKDRSAVQVVGGILIARDRARKIPG